MAARPRVIRVGADALLIELDDIDGVLVAHRRLAAARRRGDLDCRELVPAARTVLIDGLVDGPADEAVVRALLAEHDQAVHDQAVEADADPAVVEVRYDGPDLDDVARAWEVSTAEVIERHRSTEWRVAFCGFAPGFGYCAGLPEGLTTPRRERPRTRVPAGAVGLAAEFTAVYPRESPGGWQLIGTAITPTWRPDEAEPALLVPGRRVVFTDG